jgi:hypothetical protein
MNLFNEIVRLRIKHNGDNWKAIQAEFAELGTNRSAKRIFYGTLKKIGPKLKKTMQNIFSPKYDEFEKIIGLKTITDLITLCEDNLKDEQTCFVPKDIH